MSSNILPSIVFCPIFSSGFGKFFVSSPNLVAYPAAITIFFIVLTVVSDGSRPHLSGIGFHTLFFIGEADL